MQPTPLDVILSPDGHYKAFGTGAENLLVYLVETEAGERLTLSPRDFNAKYGWTNSPAKVKIDMPEPKPAK